MWGKTARPARSASGSKALGASPCAPLPSASVQGSLRERAGRDRRRRRRGSGADGPHLLGSGAGFSSTQLPGLPTRKPEAPNVASAKSHGDAQVPDNPRRLGASRRGAERPRVWHLDPQRRTAGGPQGVSAPARAEGGYGSTIDVGAGSAGVRRRIHIRGAGEWVLACGPGPIEPPLTSSASHACGMWIPVQRHFLLPPCYGLTTCRSRQRHR